MENEDKNTERKALLDNHDDKFKNPKEKLYDKIHLSVKQMDIILIVLFALLIGALIIGTLKGNGLI
ncbi:MAG: hypothetical protein RSB78_04970 [Oscillospiraceae bacterium]